ncbi:alkylphosphonate utilization protein [Streptomyces anulatus]|nr:MULTISPECIES: alkylphosphonate utilization protein [unclassified Streptomyces]
MSTRAARAFGSHFRCSGADGDSVTTVKDLKVKGTSETLKRGTLVKNIRLTGRAGVIECNTKKVKGLVLRTEFLKKA